MASLGIKSYGRSYYTTASKALERIMFPRNVQVGGLLYPYSSPVPQHVHNMSIFTKPKSTETVDDFQKPIAEKKGFFDRIKESIEERKQKNRMDQYAQQLQDLANRETFDLDAFRAQIDSSVQSGWRSIIPGLSDSQTMQGIKESQKVLQATKEIVGANVTSAILRNLDRKDKLQISIKSGVTPDDINGIFEMFSSVSIMHRILRYRKLNGLSIPTDEATAKVVLASDLPKVLSAQELRNLQKSRSKGLRGGRGTRRP